MLRPLKFRSAGQRLGVFTLLVTLVTLFAAGCGSSSSKSTATTTTPTSASSPTSAGSSPPAASSSVTQIVSAAKKLPSLTLAPLPSKPPTGKSIIFISVPSETQSVALVDAAKAAAARLGWTVSVLDYAGDPATLSAGIQEAIARKPTAIDLIGIEASTIQPALTQAAAAGILVFDDGSSVAPTGPLPSGNGYAGVIYGPENYELEGQLIADWIIQASGGKPVTVAYFTLPAYKVLGLDGEGLQKEFTAHCPSCKLKIVPVQISSIGTTLPQTATAAVQSDPSIKYEVFPFGGVDTGVVAALQAAGHSSVKLAVAASLTTADFAQIADGTEAVGTNTSSVVQGDLMVDILARYLETKKPVLEEPPNQLFDKTNAPRSGVVPVGQYAAYFGNLWHIG